MLSHYFQPDLSDEESLLAMADWIDALIDIPQQAIEQAIRERIRSDDRSRPVPGEIRKRAMARIAKPKVETEDERPFGPTLVSSDEIERRRKMAEQVRREFPMLKKIKTSEDSK